MRAGRDSDAIDFLKAAVDAEPGQRAIVFRGLITKLYEARRYREAAAYADIAVRIHPAEVELWNTRGVAHRRTGKFAEAMESFDRVLALQPSHRGAQYNRANVLLDRGDPADAEAEFRVLLKDDPNNVLLLRQLAVTLLAQLCRDEAHEVLRKVLELDPGYVDAWNDIALDFAKRGRFEEAVAACDEGLTHAPGNDKLLRNKVAIMRMSGESAQALDYQRSLVAEKPDAAWLQAQIGSSLVEHDPESAVTHLRRAVELDPYDPDNVFALIEALDRTRTGKEAEFLQDAYRVAQQALATGFQLDTVRKRVLHELYRRCLAFDDLERLGPPQELGRALAKSGLLTALLVMLSRVETREDRLDLVEQHRIWGRIAEAHASETPIKRPAPRPVGEKIRLGFMSSDLRRHAVGHFAMPLFMHLDERFEVFVYSFYQGREDMLQSYVRDRVAGYRLWPFITLRDAAQNIADDDLDMLIELGGPTRMNKIEVMTHRPAPRQASWLGYPHSVGLSAIDDFVCDPYSMPTDPALLIERPLVLPKTWLTFGRTMYSDVHVIADDLPQDRNGFITFGTANNPNKFTRNCLRAWARVVAAVPGSRFAILRPEAGAPIFRENMAKEFAAEGVSADRLDFRPQRGEHMPFYNDVDITLDCFPLTGGTTTADALWMGAPVVSLVGSMFHERLSYSMLMNAGAGELCAFNLEDYHRIAVELAGDRQRRLDLRRNLRDRIKEGPLGQTEQFATDFYEMIWRRVHEAA